MIKLENADKPTTLPKGCLEIDDLPLEVASVLAIRVAKIIHPFEYPNNLQMEVEVVEVNGLYTGFHVVETQLSPDYLGNYKKQSVLMSTSLRAKPIILGKRTWEIKMGWEVWMKVPKGWRMVTRVF